MANNKPTKAVLLLRDCLEEKGIEVILEHDDGHKHVDIFIPKAKLYIEVDGLQHYLRPSQIIADMERDFHSYQEGFKTFRIPSFVALTNYKKVVSAIEKIVCTSFN